jgi:hypothetical protein
VPSSARTQKPYRKLRSAAQTRKSYRKSFSRGADTKTLPKSATRGTTANAADGKVPPAAQCGWRFVFSRVIRRKFAGRGVGRIFAEDLMAHANMIMKRHSYFFDEAEPEIKTELLPWLGKATEEMDNVSALTVASARM